jgi:formylglycine-generating enzyme
MRALRAFLILMALASVSPGLLHCDREQNAQRRVGPAMAGSTAASVATPEASASAEARDLEAAPATSAPAPFQHPPANTSGCPEGMVRVTGTYCPAAVQICEKYHDEYLRGKQDGTVSERCLKYKKPSRCVVDKTKELDFCIDRYEYPNVVGELPWVLTSWRQAERICREQGKRLCTEDEYNFACEGPEMLPYVNGYERDPEVCNIDREYRQPDHSKQLLTYERCLENAACREELARLDQRHAIGSRLSCVSWTGAVDLNGNVNEWVSRPGQDPPHRSGLKGGWWGPVRNRCRPTVKFHKEFDYGYEAGFRCCRGFGEEKVDARFDLERYKVSPEQIEGQKTRAPQAAKTAKQAAKPAPAPSGLEPPTAQPARSSTSDNAAAAPPSASATPSPAPDAGPAASITHDELSGPSGPAPSR